MLLRLSADRVCVPSGTGRDDQDASHRDVRDVRQAGACALGPVGRRLAADRAALPALRRHGPEVTATVVLGVRLRRLHLGCRTCGAGAVVSVDLLIDLDDMVDGRQAAASWWGSHLEPVLLAVEYTTSHGTQVWNRVGHV
jgi:hypothetical protein